MLITQLSLLILLNGCVFGDLLLVNTTIGQIYGLREDFTMFLGIPYGVVDEKKPFGPAMPHPYFQTPYEAFNDSAICPQIVDGVATGTIHCLQLNVYIPNEVIQGQTLPVMVFIHGGAFVEGNGRLSTFSPKFLMRHGVIVVSVNYRLGPYGHLCHVDPKYTNQALKDQKLALRWVKNHISSFGGDKENILLFGHSSGSMSADFQLLYNNDGLFNKIILQSGQGVSPYCNEDQIPTFISTVANNIGWATENIDVDEFIKRISTINTNELVEMSKNIIFKPCIDGVFVTKTPRVKNFNNMQIMVGSTSEEMLYIYPKPESQLFDNSNYVRELRKGFFKMADSAVADVKKFYLNNTIDFTSDLGFNYPIDRTIKYYLENNASVYRYLFTYDGGRNFMKVRDNISAIGSTHGDELGYLFEMGIFGNMTETDQIIVDRICYLWTNFAKYGDPTPSPTNLLPVKWQPITAGAKPYLQIDTEVGLFNGPFQNRTAFWDSFYEKHGEYAKGISLGEDWWQLPKNKAISVDLNIVILLLGIFILLWQ